MAKIGVSKLHYAIMTTEDTTASNPVYGTVKDSGCGIVSAEINVTNNTATLYADNQVWATEVNQGEIEISLDVADLPMSVQADLLGHTYDNSEKTLIKKSSDKAPYVAVGFEFLTQDGKLAVWHYKGKFSEPSSSANTKGENTEYQTNTITATFASLKGTGDNAGRWQYNKEFAADADTTSFYASVPLASA